jgi:integrase
VAFGFLDYCTNLTTEALFPALVPHKGVLTDRWGDRFWSPYMREVIGIKDENKVLYSLRHNFKDVCRQAGLPEDVHDQLTGHSNPKVSRTYGSRLFPIEPLHEGMQKITYKGLDLSHLIKTTKKGDTK